MMNEETQGIQAYVQYDSIFIKSYKSIIKYLTYIFICVHIFGRQFRGKQEGPHK